MIIVLIACSLLDCGGGKMTGMGGTTGPNGGPSRAPSNFYVSSAGNDSNDGSAGNPWATIQHAASVVKPGYVVHVAPGTYNGSITTTVSGTAKARIRFVSDVRWGAKIVGDPGEAVWRNKGDYVDIMGFDVTGASQNGIENLASLVRIIGNKVHDIATVCDSNGGAGINNADYSAHDDDIIANIVNNVRQASGCDSKHGVGIYHSNSGGHIYNNISFANGTVGIQLWHAANAVVVANNTVLSNGMNGIVIGAGDAPGGITNDNTIVINNISVNNGNFGIQEFGTTGAHNQFLNNLTFQNSSGNLSLIHGVSGGNVTASPQFVDGANGNYQLQVGSSAIDHGISQSAPSTDFNGGTRPTGRAPDIGAFESGSAPANWPWQ